MKPSLGVHVVAERASAKDRGAYFTPPAIADYLAAWAIADVRDARVLDPTCGDGAFLQAAARRLSVLGVSDDAQKRQVYGMDLDQPSLDTAANNLRSAGLAATLLRGDFFQQAPPGSFAPSFPEFDALLGNPPFIRYQTHSGAVRRTAIETALRQGVRLSGLASSWAAILVHASAFLKPDGRLAMVMPAELLSVGYAEPIRAWLRHRFASVKLVMFERLQFDHALEDVVLLVAQGTGGCDAFSLFYVTAANDLPKLQPMDSWAVALSDDRKWTNLLLPVSVRRLFAQVSASAFTPMARIGTVALGTVTGANHYFAITDATKKAYDLHEDIHVTRIFPPSSRHHRGITFTAAAWERLREAGERVWLLVPVDGADGLGYQRYIELGVAMGVPETYKSRARRDWRRPPVVSAPDLFFTYMSHRFPRLISNRAGVTFLNSMHGLRLNAESRELKDALALVSLNSLTMLGAELYGRAYGGGVLKMEPREAGSLPLPAADLVRQAWTILKSEKSKLERQLVAGMWTSVVARVDEVILRDSLQLSANEADAIANAGRQLRSRRLDRPGGRNG